MSRHSFTRCWYHMIWATRQREKLLPGEARKEVSEYLTKYAADKNIYMKINYVNPDYVHVLIDLPTHLSIEDAFQLLKGSSSYWIYQNDLISGKFSWGRGYAGFSVLYSNISAVAEYIANQEEHHGHKSFQEEYEVLIRTHGLVVHRED